METNKIRILERDFDNYKSLDVGYHDINMIRDTILGLGKNPLPTDPKIQFDVNFNQKNKYIPDYLKCGAAYIVSSKFKGLLEKYRADAEFFPVSIYRMRQDVFIEDYYYFHLLAKEKCFDFKESSYETDDNGTVEAIDTLRLSFEELPTNNIFFVAEIEPKIICLTEKLIKAIRENDITGVKLAVVVKTLSDS